MAPAAIKLFDEKQLSNVTNGNYSKIRYDLTSETQTDTTDGTLRDRSRLGPRNGLRQVAICGMAMRLPGGIRSDQSFWDMLVNGKDTRGPIPADRYNIDGFTDRLGPKGAIKTQFGYFLEDDLTSMDTSFFTLTKTELERTDPQQRQLLEVTREALENAGEVRYRGELIGCYVGTFGEDWLQMSAKENQHAGGYIMTGHGDLMLANRVSFEYDFKGPSMVIKTGCSSSLVGLHEAFRAIQYGDCKAAVVAGSNLIMGPTTTAAMTEEGILSPDGSCKTFDAKANGFARGEAVTAVYIKSLDLAIRDGNPIRAIIRNTGTNSDGKSQGLMTPNGKSHEALMRKVYAEAGLNPALTGFVECHGTGTPTGDPIETTAVGEVFGPSGVYIGSVKPNVGHSEGASGITSVIKAVLALENGIIPPNIKFSRPNPKIPFFEKQLKVPLQATAWPEHQERWISVNSFGIGGSNAHVILDAAENHYNRDERSHNGSNSHARVIFLSANTQDSVRGYAERIREYIVTHPQHINDLAYTLAFHREKMIYRAYVIIDEASGTESTEVSPPMRCPNEPLSVAMVFSGQGAQWPQMGRELLRSDGAFKEMIDNMDKILQSFLHPPSWSIKGNADLEISSYPDELQKPAELSRINQAELAQPLTTAIQIALVDKLRRLSVVPSAVVGHSSGEIAAAYASESLSLKEALLLAYYRGFVTKDHKLRGGMAAVGLSASQASRYLIPGVVIACDNSPSSVTLSGDSMPLQSVLETITNDKPGVLARQLKVDIAYHSHHMKDIADKYESLVRTEILRSDCVRQKPSIQFWSSVTAGCIQDSQRLGTDYFKANLTSQVCFNLGVQRILEHQPNTLFLEIGPHSTLAGPLREICSAKGLDCTYIPTMRRGQNSETSVLAAIGQLFQNDVFIDNRLLYPTGRTLTNLPQYAWKHSGPYWYESRLSKEWRLRNLGHHGLLGLRVPESTVLEPTWRNMLSLEDQPWIADHKIVNDVVFPFAGYISMAGEAVQQTTGIDSGYRIRNAVARTALVLVNSAPVELVTSLRPRKPNDLSNSAWFEFTISSFSGSAWIINCHGQVRAIAGKSPHWVTPKVELVRHVAVSQWYQAMAHIGIVYGPQFQGLSDIISSTTASIARGKIMNSSSHSHPQFPVHPASIDACFQLLLVAMAKGIGRTFGSLRVPTTIQDLIIYQSAQDMEAVAWNVGTNGAAIDCAADGRLVLQLRGLQLTPMNNGSRTSSLEPHAAARLEWKTYFDLADHSKLFKPPSCIKNETWMQEQMTLLCMLETAERIRGLKACRPHFEKFRSWLYLEIERATNGTYPLLLDEARGLVTLSTSARAEFIEKLYGCLLKMSTKSAVAIGIKRIYDSCDKIFTGEGDTLDILMQDDVLTHIYDAVSFGKGPFFRSLSHTRPMLRILEVGAGTGGTTEMILRELIEPDSLPCYSLYTFTDISAGFFPQAKERFSYAPNMEYRTFDISKSPFEQGFEHDTYDVLLAPNVIHATPSLQETLNNLQPLLKPGGRLVLTELCAEVRTPNYIFGNLSGWWLGEEDGRPYEPYVSVERWNDELKRAGFSGVDTAIRDADPPYHYCAAIVSCKLVKTESIPKVSCSVTVLCENPENGISKRFIDDLTSAGLILTVCRLGEIPAPHQAIVSLLDVEGYFFENITAEWLDSFQRILRSAGQTSPILWTLRPTQIKCQDPRSGQAIGVARSIRAESSVPFYTLEISETEKEFSHIVLHVLKTILNSEDNELLSPDKEFAVDDGVVKVGRYQPFLVEKELSCLRVTGNTSTASRLEAPVAGQLDSLQWVQEPFEPKVGGSEVLVDTRAIGLNFKDVLYAMGVLRNDEHRVPLGLEIAGVIRQVGADVQGLSIGDRVLAIPPSACASTAIVMPASLVQKIPDSLTFEGAATMPICFSTVIESLVNLGSLEKGQSVLIHSATGGVGHAAIQICRMIGAEIYATVGSETKVQYLTTALGVPRNRIFSSRDDSFVTDLMHATKQRGVDLVLNSLSGELLHASWDCVAEFGKMIELGKKDGAEFGKLQMNHFLLSRSYCSVDMTHLAQKRPLRVKAILKQIVDLYSEGKIQPLAPVTFFEAEQAQSAFRHLQNSDHIGKTVIKVPLDFSVVPTTPRANGLRLQGNVSYLLTGGLGGLGKSISTWLVEQGARSLVFLSRSANSVGNRKFIRELESSGCAVTVIPGRAEVFEDVLEAVSQAPSSIRGVIHLAMVLKDSPVVSMTYSDWLAANAPKVTGAWNIHQAFKENNSLDFFVLASSLVTIVEQPGQGNYSAANTHLEAFCQWRRSLSLPASILNICPIDGIGFVAENSFARKNLKAQGLYFLGESELLDFLELAILASPPATPQSQPEDVKQGWKNTGQIVMGLRSEGDLNDSRTRTNWRRDIRMGFYHNSVGKVEGDRGGSNELKAYLSALGDDPDVLSQPESVRYLATEIGKKICSFMLKPEEDLDITLSLAQIGLDSLMAIELRRWWKIALGLEISVLEIMATGSIEALGALAAQKLRTLHTGEESK